MRISTAVFFLLISSLPAGTLLAQAPAQKPPTSSPPGAAAPGPAQTAAPAPSAATPAPVTPGGPAATIQPALDTVQQTLTTVKVDKWKKGSVREEASDHIGVIQRDLKETMPPLLAAADAAPNSASALLPLSRNIDAVYDILLSVVEAARVSGPAAHVTELDQALRGLNTARVTFDEHLQQTADAAEKQIADLQATVKAQAAIKCPVLPPPVIPVCPAPAPAPKVHRKPKPPAATTPGTTPAPATTKPSA